MNINKSEVMKTSWQLFRNIYKFPSISFKAIGRRCFAWCVKEAWRQLREAARKAAMTVDQMKVRIERLTYEIDRNEYRRWTPELSTETRDMRIELDQLTARLAA